jgi:HlyD family secretion protein
MEIVGSIKKYPFRPGMSATVDIQTETRKDIISVPIQAVTTRSLKNVSSSSDKEAKKVDEGSETVASNESKASDDEKVEVVFVYKDGKVFKQAVKTGIQDSENIEITEGLKTGDEIVVAPFNAINKLLNDSTKVKKVDEAELFKPKK